jgi:putative ABC transport system permease protein
MWRDLKFALRMLGRERLLSAVVVVTAALGIGGSTAVFSVVSAVLIRDLPYSNAGQLYVMRALAPDGLPGNVTRREFAPIYERENHPTVEIASIAWSQASQIVGLDRRPHPTIRYGVTDRFFDVFGVRMALGRGFQPGEQLGRIVISHQVWRDVFGSDADIIGKTVAAEGQNLQVVGVTPADFEFPQDPGFWYLMRLGAGFDKVRAYRGFMRLRPGRTQEQIDRDLRRLAADLGADPVTNQTPVLVAQPMLEYVVGDLKVTVLILFGATGILLLIACINVTNLLLSRTAARSREVALREAIGAGRWRIVYQLLAESVVLVTIGGALGLMVSAAGSRILLALAPEGLPRLDSLPMDSTVLLFATGLTLATGVLVGLAPAWRLARNQLRNLMNEAGRGSSGGPASARLFSALVVTEIALAVVLMIGAGLLIRSFVNLTTADPGFNPHGVLTFSMNVPGRVQMEVIQGAQGKPERRPTYAPMAAFFRDLEERIGTVSSVESLATTTSLPLVAGPGGIVVVFTLPGQSGTNGDAAWTTTIQAVSPEFFQTMKMHLVSGRDLSRSDRQGSSGAAVVSETFARQFFAGQNPLGQRIRWKDNRYVPTDTGFQFGHLTVDEVEVVGVVADAKLQSLAKPPEPTIYISSEQFIFRRRAVVVRTSLDKPESLVPVIRRELDSIDPQLGAQFGVYDSLIRASIARERLGMTLLVAFGFAAMLLAAVGVYGLMSYSVAQRTGEIAVRSAMGASATQVMRLVMGRGMGLAALGVVLGTIGAVALRQVVASELYGVSPLDLSVFLLVTTVLFGVAAVACFLPARRAMKIDPVSLLRNE